MDDQQKIIEKYLDNRLSETERMTFEHRLKEEKTLAKAVQIERDIRDGIEALGNQKLSQRLNKIHEEEIIIPRQKKKWRLIRQCGVLIAAALIGAIFLSWYLWPKAAMSSEQLYLAYAQHDIALTQKGAGENPLILAERAWEKQDLAAAQQHLDIYLSTNPNDPEALHFQGIVLLENRSYDEALRVFEHLATYGLYADVAKWYQGLILLRAQRLDAAKEIFTAIATSNTDYAGKAQEIIKELKD